MPSNGTSKTKRRRRHVSETDDEPISMWKIGLVIAVILLCFAMLYPTLFRPFVASFLSSPTQPQQNKMPNRPPIHPSMAGPRTHPDIHPGMRMAGNQGQTMAPSSNSKGMLAWFLPIYTIGVVSFLLYTLFKSKKKKRRRSHAYSTEESETDEEDEETRYDTGNLKLGKKKLQSLQERLKQTEMAMEKILEQLGTITNEQQQQRDTSTKPTEDDTAQESEQNATDNGKYLKNLEKALKDFEKLSRRHAEKGKRVQKKQNVSEDESENDVYEVIETGLKGNGLESEEEDYDDQSVDDKTGNSDDQQTEELIKSDQSEETNLKRRSKKAQSGPSKP